MHLIASKHGIVKFRVSNHQFSHQHPIKHDYRPEESCCFAFVINLFLCNQYSQCHGGLSTTVATMSASGDNARHVALLRRCIFPPRLPVVVGRSNLLLILHLLLPLILSSLRHHITSPPPYHILPSHTTYYCVPQSCSLWYVPLRKLE